MLFKSLGRAQARMPSDLITGPRKLEEWFPPLPYTHNLLQEPMKKIKVTRGGGGAKEEPR